MDAFGIGWTSECLCEFVRTVQHRPDRLKSRGRSHRPNARQYVIGPDEIVAYADINVDYRSEPELSAVLLVLRVAVLQNATS
jgi:hypothetical protein